MTSPAARQAHAKSGALCQSALHGDLAAQEAAVFPDDPQPDAEAAGMALSPSLEALEDTLLIGFGDAHAVVLHAQRCPLVIAAHGDRDRLSVPVADRVRDQVGADLFEPQPVPGADQL